VPRADVSAFAGQEERSSSSSGGGGEEENENENGAPFFVWKGCLGIAFWAIPLVYQHAWTQLIPLLRLFMKRQPPRQTVGQKEEGGEEDDGEKQIWAKRAEQLSRVVLLINADNYTAWNLRKRLISETGTSSYEELKYVCPRYNELRPMCACRAIAQLLCRFHASAVG